jgi:hypothetical protein
LPVAHHARRLVDQSKVVVLIDDGQVKGWWAMPHYRKVATAHAHLMAHLVAGMDAVADSTNEPLLLMLMLLILIVVSLN